MIFSFYPRPPHLTSRKHIYFPNVILLQHMRTQQNELWWQVLFFFSSSFPSPAIYSSSNKQWHYLLQSCHKQGLGRCFQLQYHWSHWLGCVSIPCGTGFHATSAVVTLQNILNYSKILQNSQCYSLPKLSLIVQPIPKHK